MIDKKNIVVVGSFADSLLTFRGHLLRAMAERGHRVLAGAPAASMTVRDALAAMGIAYCDIPFDRAGLSPGRDLWSVYRLVALFREFRPDVVLSYTIKPVIYASLAARFSGVPNIFSMITGASYAFTTEGGVGLRAVRIGTRMLYKWSLRYNRRVIFQNPDDCALFERRGLVRSREQATLVNGSGVDLEFFRPSPFPPDVSFLLIARFLRDKGVLEYVEAARIVKAKHKHIAFRLVGWIDDHPTAIKERELHAWVEEGVVEYLGRLEDVRPAITASSVYVLPSHQEGTPRTVLEAMAMGRPVVTTDAPGCRETVRPGHNGYLVPVRNAVALAETLERFIVEPGLIATMGRNSRQLAEAKYDVHEVNRAILGAMGLA